MPRGILDRIDKFAEVAGKHSNGRRRCGQAAVSLIRDGDRLIRNRRRAGRRAQQNRETVSAGVIGDKGIKSRQRTAVKCCLGVGAGNLDGACVAGHRFVAVILGRNGKRNRVSRRQTRGALIGNDEMRCRTDGNAWSGRSDGLAIQRTGNDIRPRAVEMNVAV